MSDNIKTGGPAFPHDWQAAGGMTLRDYFAAKAMAAMIAEPPFQPGLATVASRHCDGERGELNQFAIAAYRMADAMIAARDA